MRTHGTLTKWNDDRGFGFIAQAQGGEELFVHISAFPQDGQRPRVGELVSFEVDKGAEGKSRAVRVMRPGRRPEARRPRQVGRRERTSSWGASLMTILAIAAIGAYGYSRYSSAPQPQPVAAVPAAPVTAFRPAAASAFQCDGRTSCSQMNSCAEARYFVQHCPDTTMDGDGDGEPCERQWCN